MSEVNHKSCAGKYDKENNKSPKSFPVAVISEMISKAKSIAVVDYTKMTPNQATELRKSVKAVGGEIKVEKTLYLKLLWAKMWILVDSPLLSSHIPMKFQLLK